MRLWAVILLYAVVAVIAYALIYYTFFAGGAPPTNGAECTPTFYRPCP